MKMSRMLWWWSGVWSCESRRTLFKTLDRRKPGKRREREIKEGRVKLKIKARERKDATESKDRNNR